MSEALKPCPFCGGEPELYREDFDNSNFVRCTGCGARAMRYHESPPGLRAIPDWNRRAPLLSPEEREALECVVRILFDEERPSYDWDKLGVTIRALLGR